MHTSKDIKKNAYRRGAAIIAALLSFNTLAGCGILGDGEVTIVTAPPIVQQRVIATNNYQGAATRFDVAGDDAFYLLPGIENHPDYLQDFSCLDYTKEGWFIYYYCGPSYISKDEVAAYKGTTGTAPKTNRYPDIDRDGTALCDAYVFMMYNPATLEYKVIDAQGYIHKTTSTSQTGMEFYESENYGFYMLSHAYGCKIFGTEQYFILDQNGGANVYDSTGKNLSSIAVGDSISLKAQEVATSLGAQNGAAATGSDSAIKSDSDADKEEMEEAIKEIGEATKHSYDTGKTDKKKDIKLNCLIKSAVMDGNNRMYLSVMLYTGESPWVSEIMYNRVICIYSVDLTGGLIQFVATNEHYRYQQYLYGRYGTLDYFKLGEIKSGAKMLYGVKNDIYRHPGGLDLFDTYGRREYAAVLAGVVLDDHIDISDYFSADQFFGFKSDNPKFNAIVVGMPGDLDEGHVWGRKIYEQTVNWLLYEEDILGKGMPDRIVWSADAIKYNRYRWEDYAQRVNKLDRLPNMEKYNVTTGLNDSNLPTKDKINNDYLQALLVAYTPTVDIETMDEDEALKRARKLRFGAINLYPTADGETPFGTVYVEPYKYNDTPYYAYKYVKDEYWDRLSKLNEEKNKESLKEKSPAYQYLINVAKVLQDYYDSLDTKKKVYAGMNITLYNHNTRHLLDTILDFAFGGNPQHAPVDNFLNLVYSYNESFYEKYYLNESGFGRGNTILISGNISNSNEFFELYGDKLIDVNDVMAALQGYVKDIDESKTIPANTIPVSYRLVFPEGATVLFADMTEAEGSSTSSIRDGALLFSDNATLLGGKMVYSSAMARVTDSGIDYKRFAADGAAIDTGAFQISSVSKGQGKTEYKDAWMLITDKEVSFAFVTNGKTNTGSYTLSEMDIANEDLLSSSGFTIHTENEASHATLKRSDIDNEGESKITEEKLSKYLNSTRVGTIQSASSFTALNENEVLISAYDTGATILNLHDLDGTYSVTPIRSGSYYQSFPTTQDGKYVIVGYDTEEYMYSSMDLARAKAYVLDYKSDKAKVYKAALEKYLDQLAVDYVRRQYRTRENENGVIEVLEYNDDNSAEAELEQKLFADKITDENAIQTLKEEVENPRRVEHVKSMEDYLITLRKRVRTQKDAMQEVLTLTGADKLGVNELGVKKIKEPYWVNLLSRIQNASDLGNLKELLCEIVMHEDMKGILEEEDEARYARLKTSLEGENATVEEKAEVDRIIAEMKAKDKKTYAEIRKILNYTKEHKDVIDSLSESDTGNTAKKKTENSDTQKDVSGEEGEDNTSADKEYKVELDSLKDENMDKTMTRMEAEALVLEDIEEMYFYKHPLSAEYYYGPNGKDSESPAISVEKEDEVWEAYLAGLLTRISPDNLALARDKQIEDMAAFCYAGAEGLDDKTKESMRKAVIEGLEKARSIMDVEELILSERMKLAAFIKYRNDYSAYKSKTWESDYDRIEYVRRSLWYIEMKKELIATEQVQSELLSRGFSWEEYLQAVVMSYTGRQLKDDISGGQVTAESDIGAVRYFDKLLDFICIGAGEVSEAARREMLEELLRGMQTVSDARGAEEAVIVMRMTLPAYGGYLGEYKKYKATAYTSAAEQTEAYYNTKFYKNLIVKLKESDDVKTYLEESEMTWDAYMASLVAMAPDAGDPAAAVRQYYNIETEPEPTEEAVLLDECNTPKVVGPGGVNPYR